ncbi:lipocalin family protein [Sulfitobacter sp.]|uniref:lipocalin family protein n=1 Tax=Sulfitobacter sp. TaxID=1903071 RepID=UPI003001F5FC
MIRGLLTAALVALGACAGELPAPLPVGPIYRDQSALIGVTSRFDEKKFGGVWYVRAGFDRDIDRMAFRIIDGPKGSVMRLGVFVCDPAGVCGDYSEDLPLTRQGKGQFRVKMPNGQTRNFWVLWVDEGFRTAVLGNKTGDFGWIVDRSTKGGADRIKAAREILDFNGYDVRQLRTVK